MKKITEIYYCDSCGTESKTPYESKLFYKQIELCDKCLKRFELLKHRIDEEYEFLSKKQKELYKELTKFKDNKEGAEDDEN